MDESTTTTPEAPQARHYLRVDDFSEAEIREALRQGFLVSIEEQKERAVQNGNHIPGAESALKKSTKYHWKGIRMYFAFMRDSLRTRQAVERAIDWLGGSAQELPSTSFVDSETKLDRECPEHLAATMSAGGARILDMRADNHHRLMRIAEAAGKEGISVVNTLTSPYKAKANDEHAHSEWNDPGEHPTQALADIAAYMAKRQIKPHEKTPLKNHKCVFAGDFNNVCISLAKAWVMLGGNFAFSGPVDPAEDDYTSGHWSTISALAKENGGSVSYIKDLKSAVQSANYIYTDVWASMGQKVLDDSEERIDYSQYKVTSEIVAMAAEDVLVGHCLPVGMDKQGNFKEIDEAVAASDKCIYKEIMHHRFTTTAAVMNILLKDQKNRGVKSPMLNKLQPASASDLEQAISA